MKRISGSNELKKRFKLTQADTEVVARKTVKYLKNEVKEMHGERTKDLAPVNV